MVAPVRSPAARFHLTLAAVAVLGGAARAAHVDSILSSPAGGVLVQDARVYQQIALRLVGSIEPSGVGGVSFMNVGYPFVLAAIYSVAGVSIAAALAAQVVADTLCAVMIAVCARRLGLGDRAAIVTGGLYAVYAGAVFYDGLLLTPAWTNALVAAAMLGLAAALEGRRLPAAASGIACGLAALLRSNMLLLVPLAAVVLLRRDPRTGRRGSGLAALFLAGASAAIVPVVVRNGIVHGQWVALSANGGMNFWIGNHRGATGTYAAAPFVAEQNASGEESAFHAEARRRTGRPDLDAAGSSRYWFRESLSEIAAARAGWVTLLAGKAALFWSRHEAKTNVSLRFHEILSPPLAWMPLRWSVLAVLGAGGLVFLGRSGARDGLSVALVPIVAAFATCVAFFVSGEYRHPASLGLCLAAGAWIAAVARRRGTQSAGLVPSLVAGALLVPLVVRIPPGVREASDPAIDFANHARALCTPAPDGRPPGGAELSRAAALLDLAPRDGVKRLFVADARLWVHTLAATTLADPVEAASALASARALLEEDLRRGRPGYSDSFLAGLRRSLPARLDRLAASDVVRRDPGLRREADDLARRAAVLRE